MCRKMGRTRRRRNKNRGRKPTECTAMINLQKTMKVKFRNVRVSYFNDTGRGVRCTKNLEEGDVLIALPLWNLITPRSPSKVFSLLKEYERHPQLDLTVLLIYENHLGPDSEYFNYLATLPQSYTNLYFCTENEVDLLPCFLKKTLFTQKEMVENMFDKLLKCLTDMKCPHCGLSTNRLYTRERFLWAWFTVNTRSVHYETEEKSTKLMALAPLLDMFNHCSKAETNMTIDFKNQLYILKTFKKYRKFSQAFIKYGCHSNTTLLLEYGFILHDNLYDVIEFSWDEILASVKECNPNFGAISKLKYNFICQNKLNQNLNKNMDEFSWNFNGLVYVLITQDENINVLQSKTYSSDFSNSEQFTVMKVKEILTGKKLRELENALLEMNQLEKCTESFRQAKELLKIHMDILRKV